ncbi:class C beta-lactamase [Ferrovibrio sp.]|uniref:class C beta-lactamase n=1 Tax=Ferrovibrio sp. TaxID=1917215 RepID=UPI000CAC053E|nr:class C beta-lactamase [Ferrovibrio sp.]PJI43791.1 MAG: class C beta-lactamase [Ferrovibrio sp.]
MRAAILAGLFSIFACASTAQAADADLRNIVDRAFRPLLQAHDVPGMAVAITASGRTEIVTYGVASKESKAPVTPDTLFELGSVSKTFTGILGGYAVALGRTTLNDHPGQYLPALRGSAVDRATLLQLGTYTAGGLPLQFPADVTSHERMIDWLQHWSPSAAPGTQRRYSNPSIGLFGHLAAMSLGRDFATLAERELFPQFGLRSTFVRVPKPEMARYAQGYDRANRPVRVNPGVFDAEAYGVKSSAADMIRFIQCNLRPAELEPPMRRAVEIAQSGYAKIGSMIQGLGWEQYSWPVKLEQLQAGNGEQMSRQDNAATTLSPPQPPSASRLYNKTGATNGFGAYVAFLPEKNVGLVMLANRNLPIPARVTAAHAVLDQLARP